MELLVPIILVGSLLLGLAVGSFIAARAVRTAKQLPANLWGRSECLSCKTSLKGRDLVPVFSYLVLGGKCRHCKAPVTSVYLWIELDTALLFCGAMALGLWTNLFPLPLDAATNLVFFLRAGLSLAILATLIYVTALDLMIMAFPVATLMVMTILTFLVSLQSGYPTAALDALTGAIAFPAVLAIIRFVATKVRGIEAMGIGDIYIAALIGMSLGLRHSIVAFYAAFILGALVSIILLVKKRSTGEVAALPFAPFLALGWFVATFFGSTLFTLLFPIM